MIVAMETWQYTALRSSFAQHHEKLFLLPLLDSIVVGRGYAAFNIQDPYGGPPSAQALSQSVSIGSAGVSKNGL